MIEKYTPKAWTVLLHKICEDTHEVIRTYSRTHNEYTALPWKQVDLNDKLSLLKDVIEVMNNPEKTPREAHETWMNNKLADGWVFGREKSVKGKTHPCLVPYDELPEYQRFKDDLFLQCIRNGLSIWEIMLKVIILDGWTWESIREEFQKYVELDTYRSMRLDE